MTKYDAYVICTNPRSGSTLLCRLLAASGVAGNPDSYFHRPSVVKWLESFNLLPNPAVSERDLLGSIFRAAIARGSRDTGIFGLRLQRHSFDFFSTQLATLYPDLSNDKQRFCRAFGRTCFIHLTRQDKIEQAVSLLKAEQSGLWHVAADGSELERQSPPKIPTYDSARIHARIKELTEYDRLWRNWFENEQINPLTIDYEKLAACPVKTFKDILEHLAIDCKMARDVKPEVLKMADKTSKDWVDRFRIEFTGSVNGDQSFKPLTETIHNE